jgi:hypothetical protein
MAVATYTTDLQLITDAESGTFVELTGWARGGISAGTETDYYIQGSGCKSGTVKDGLNSIALVVTEFTVPDPGAVFFWQVLFAPNSLDTFDNGGQRCVVGTDASNFYWWNSGGSDTYPNNFYGSWKNIAISPTVTPDGTAGSPVGSRSTGTIVGLGTYLPTTYPSKGAPFGYDAVRYGRGQLRAEYGTSTGPANFTDMAFQNDTGPNRWGLCSLQGGTFIQKGLLSIGHTGACYFEDSNKAINIDDTPRATGVFNKWEVNGTDTVFSLTNCTVASLGATSPGDFEMVDNATGVTFDACLFKDMGTFTFLSNGTTVGSTFLRCDTVFQGSSSITNTVFSSSKGSAALSADSVTTISDLSFISQGTGWAIEGFASAGSYTLNGITYAGYDSGTGSTGNTGDRALHITATSGTATIYYPGGDSPSYYSEGATVNLVGASYDFKFTLTPNITGYEWRIYSVTAIGSLDGSAELDGEETGTVNYQTYTYQYVSPVNIAVQILSQPVRDYEESINYYILADSDQDVSIILIPDENN